MTTVLLAITFLVFYGLGMSAYRRQSVVILRCNDTESASDVFYHHIIPRDAYLPFSRFSEYLSHMAKKYPKLHYNVYFLIDDSWQSSISNSGHLRILKRLVPQITGTFNVMFGQTYKKDIKDFQRKYQNVNISVMYLSKYMAMTPLKYKWRTFPPNYLSFYARIYAIWQNGGIGFDLITFNNQFNQKQAIDHRLHAILQQHNDGIKSEIHNDAFKSFDTQANELKSFDKQENDLFAMFFSMINEILNESCSFFEAYIPDNIKTNNTPIIRTHRSKRKIMTFNDTNISSNVTVKNDTTNDYLNNGYNVPEKVKNLNKNNTSTGNNRTNLWNSLKELKNQRDIFDLFTRPNISNFNLDVPNILFFYDISGFSDSNMGPPYFTNNSPNLYDPNPIDLGAMKIPYVKLSTHQGHSQSNYLSLTAEGHFVAASSLNHPFLSQLLSSASQRISPEYAIRDTLLSQCPGNIRDDLYCNSIRVIFNVV